MTNKKKKVPIITLIIPAYNETTRLISGLYHILTYFATKRYSWELIIVDDGSAVPIKHIVHKAKTANLLHTPHAKLPMRIYRLPKNYGKGKAIAYGVTKAHGRVIIFCDADLSVPVSVISQILSELKQYPIVITSRRTPKSKIVIHQSFLRETAGRIFTILSNMLCATGVADATCGCKGFSCDAAKRLFGASRIHRWVFDTEIIFLARKYGYSILELPIQWTNREGSKVRLWDTLGSLYDLLRIRWYEARGMYNK
jgi:dolichyl-phosphate beta-glucosyltransferase